MALDEPRLIFVGGAHGRTGTTLMKRLLCSHPSVAPAAPGETRLLEAVAALRPQLSQASPWYAPARASRALLEFQHAVRGGFGDTPAVADALRRFGRAIGVTNVRGAQSPPQPHASAAPESVLDHAFGALVGDLLRPAARAAAASHVVEKTPSNAQFAVLLRSIRPDARLVVMTRDPLAVALSHTRRPWGPADPIDAARYTRRYLDRWATVRERLDEGTALEVSHSALVADPAAVMQRVLSFAGLPAAPEVETTSARLVREPDDRSDGLDADVLAAARAELSQPVVGGATL